MSVPRYDRVIANQLIESASTGTWEEFKKDEEDPGSEFFQRIKAEFEARERDQPTFQEGREPERHLGVFARHPETGKTVGFIDFDAYRRQVYLREKAERRAVSLMWVNGVAISLMFWAILWLAYRLSVATGAI